MRNQKYCPQARNRYKENEKASQRKALWLKKLVDASANSCISELAKEFFKNFVKSAESLVDIYMRQRQRGRFYV